MNRQVYPIEYIIDNSYVLIVGTCMCIKCNVNYLVAGFEEGSVALFDHRKQLDALTELKAHDEPGVNWTEFLYVLVVMCCIVMCVHCNDNGLGVTGSADDVLSVFTINEMVSIHSIILR